MREIFKVRADDTIEIVGGVSDGLIVDACPCGHAPTGNVYLVAWRKGGFALCHEGCIEPRASGPADTGG